MMTAVRRSESCARHVLAASLVATLLVGNGGLGQEQMPSGGLGQEEMLWSNAAQATPHRWAGISSLEQFLTRALAIHPEIVVAQAKVESAEEELRRTRFQVARELIAFWYDWKARERDVAEITPLADQNVVSQTELIDAKAKLAQLESQLPYLLRDGGGTGTRRAGAAGEVGSKRLPEGPEVEKILEALNSLTELEFIETPLQDVADTLGDFHRVTFVVDPTVKALPVTASIRSIPLGAALQAAEVLTPGVRFVVCDYGILVTSDTSDAAATYISANDLWRERQTQQDPSGRQRQAAPQTGKEGRTPVPADPFAPAPVPTEPQRPQPGKAGSAPVSRDPFAPGPPPSTETKKPQ